MNRFLTAAAAAALVTETVLAAKPLQEFPTEIDGRRIETFWQYGETKRGEAWDVRNAVIVEHPVAACDHAGAPLYVVLHSAGHDVLSTLDCTRTPGNHDIYHSPTNFYALYLDCRANSPTDWWWGAKTKTGVSEVPCEKRVIDTVREVIAKYAIDANRVYLSGNSMGGSGTLGIGLRHGDVFAAIKANVPAIRWFDHPFKAMGWSPYALPAGAELPEPPFLVDYSAQNDAWSFGHERLIDGMRERRYGWALFWATYGHANNHAKMAEKNDVIHDLDWLSIRKDAAYPVFTCAASDAESPWPIQLHGDVPVVKDGRAGQINGFFRWRNVADTPDRFEMDLWLAQPPTKIAELRAPAETTAMLTFRRLQRFSADEARWSFGCASGTVVRRDGVYDSVKVKVTSTPVRFRLGRK